MIRLENVTKFYQSTHGRHYVFRNVTLEIPEGINVGIIGRNGAGKTTLLRLIGGIDTPNGGRIVRTGRISWPLGLTSPLQNSLTGLQNARFVCRIQSIPPGEIPAKLADIEQMAAIGRFFDRPVNTYSSGMKQRLKFAITMAFDFDTYLLDEASAGGGDLGFSENSKAAFRAKRDKASFIICSHSLNEILSDCDAAVLLEKGELTYFEYAKDAIMAYLKIMTPDAEEEFARLVHKIEKKRSRSDSQLGAVESGEGDAALQSGRDEEAAHEDLSLVPGATETSMTRSKRRAERKKAREAGGNPKEHERRRSDRRARRQSAEHKPIPHTPAPMAPRIRKFQNTSNETT